MDFPTWLLDSLCDPLTKEALDFTSAGVVSSPSRQYSIINGTPSLIYPSSPQGMDLKMSRLYKWLAPFYDTSERILGKLFTGQDIVEGRKDIVQLLQLPSGIKLLEVSPGPGVFQPLLRSVIGMNGELVSVDLSLPMLRQCQSIQDKTRAYLIQANASYLPFADSTFDAVFHFGGVNLFAEPERALTEFVRVVKPTGIVAYGDERFAADYPEGWRKEALKRMNPGYLKNPPPLPKGVCDATEHAVYGGLGYLVVAKRES